jgi:hypothetical protein
MTFRCLHLDGQRKLSQGIVAIPTSHILAYRPATDHDVGDGLEVAAEALGLPYINLTLSFRNVPANHVRNPNLYFPPELHWRYPSAVAEAMVKERPVVEAQCQRGATHVDEGKPCPLDGIQDSELPLRQGLERL